MDVFILAAIALGFGWVAWSIRGPKVDTDIKWDSGKLTVGGQVSAHQKSELHEFFSSQFQDERLQVSILAHSPSQPTRPRIRIRGTSTDADAQLIRNFLTSLLM